MTFASRAIRQSEERQYRLLAQAAHQGAYLTRVKPDLFPSLSEFLDPSEKPAATDTRTAEEAEQEMSQHDDPLPGAQDG